MVSDAERCRGAEPDVPWEWTPPQPPKEDIQASLPFTYQDRPRSFITIAFSHRLVESKRPQDPQAKRWGWGV